MITNYIALDIGEKRIGVACANSIAKIPRAVTVLKNDESFNSLLADIIQQESASVIIVGLPRNLDGQETKQSAYCRNFAQQHLIDQYTVVWQDETLSTREAENRTPSGKGSDADAACVILDDFLQDRHEI